MNSRVESQGWKTAQRLLALHPPLLYDHQILPLLSLNKQRQDKSLKIRAGKDYKVLYLTEKAFCSIN